MNQFTKKCSCCNQEKPVSEFGKFARGKLGVKSECKKCFSLRNKKRYLEKEGEIKEKVKDWQQKNVDKVKFYKETYYKKNKDIGPV